MGSEVDMKHFRQYIVASTEEEAVGLREAVGAKSLYIAGGTTVVPRAAASVEVLIDITRLGLDGIVADDSTVRIGATTRLADLASADAGNSLPLLRKAVMECATPLIRNMATLGGSLATIFLPSDPGLALLALDAEAEVLTPDGVQRLKMADLLKTGWFDPVWLIRRVLVSKQAPGEGSAFLKFGRNSVDIALVAVGVRLRLGEGARIESLRIVVGQTSTVPVVVDPVTEKVLGQDFRLELAGSVADEVCRAVKARNDFRASSEFRTHLIKVLVSRGLVQAALEAGYRDS